MLFVLFSTRGMLSPLNSSPIYIMGGGVALGAWAPDILQKAPDLFEDSLSIHFTNYIFF